MLYRRNRFLNPFCAPSNRGDELKFHGRYRPPPSPFTRFPMALNPWPRRYIAVKEPPEPSDVIWENLGVRRRTRFVRRSITVAISLILVLISATLVSGLMTRHLVPRNTGCLWRYSLHSLFQIAHSVRRRPGDCGCDCVHELGADSVVHSHDRHP
jgi:hypothetical protein